MHAAGHVAVDEEADPAEQLFFFQVRERPRAARMRVARRVS